MERFALAAAVTPQIVPIGRNAEPVIVIDGVMADWTQMRGFAATQDYRDVGRNGGFPGLRAPLPGDYVRSLLRRLDPLIRATFFAERAVKLGSFDCNLSLVTYAPAALHPTQKLPHVDFAAENRVAVLHYLCAEHFGGTAFYRHLGLDAEQIGPELRESWLAARQEEKAALPPDAGYPDQKTPGYHRIAAFDARPDRLLIYRSHTLHSGIIDRPELLSFDPQTGRLTANFFLDYVRA